jgi:hypothetical protein
MSAPTYIQDIETAIVNQIKSSMTDLLTVRGVRDIKTALMVGSDIVAPSVLVVFDSEQAQPSNTIGIARQTTNMQWRVIVVAQSFSTLDDSGPGAYDLVDEVLQTLLGFQVSTSPVAKLFYVGSRQYGLNDTWVVYEVSMTHPYLRQEA